MPIVRSPSIAGNRRGWFQAWFWYSVILLLVVSSEGQINPHYVPDSASYIHYPFDSLDRALRSTRLPGYPLLLAAVQATLGLAGIPILQAILHAAASASVATELRLWKSGNAASFAAGLAINLGCTPLDHLSTISTDAPAASLGVITAMLVMRWVRLEGKLSAMLPICVTGVIAISLRPAYLALPIWIVVCATLLFYRHSLQMASSQLKSIWRLGWVSILPGLAITAVVFAWMGLRWWVVSDFAILPFGHQNLSGVTVQLLSDDELQRLSGGPGRIAQSIVSSRERNRAAGYALAPGPDNAYMTIESRWDEYVWRIIYPATQSLYGDDAIASHRALAQFNRTIIQRYPLRYVRWLLLAERRAIWGSVANVLMQPIFLIAICTACCLEVWRAVYGYRYRPPSNDAGLDALTIVAVTYFLIMSCFVVLSSPALGRFVDAIAIFIPAVFAARCVRYFSFLERPAI